MADSLKPDAQIIRSAGLLGIITIISRILGLVREIFIAATLGTSVNSDAFTLAFSVPDLFRRLFAEGSLVNIFIPTFTATKQDKGNKAAFEFAGNLFTLMSLGTLLICLVFIAAAPLFVKYILASGFSGESLNTTILLTRIMLGYIFFISMASVYQGLLNSFSVFWVSSLTPVLLNLSIIGTALILSPYLDNPAIGFAIGVIIGGFIQFLFHIPFIYKLKIKINFGINWRDPLIKRTVHFIIPTIFGIGIYQINILISNIIASTLNSGSVSSLKFSNRLLEFITGVVVVSIVTVLLPKASLLFFDNQMEKFKENLMSSINMVTFLTVPVAVGGFFLSQEIISILFSRGEFGASSINLTNSAFRYHILGLIFIAWNRLLLTFYQASAQIKILVRSGIVIVIVNIIIALVLKQYMGHNGIALATTFSQFVHTVLLVFFLRNFLRLSPRRLFINKSNLMSFISSGIMLAVLSFIVQIEIMIALNEIIRCIILSLSGAIVYLFISKIFNAAPLHDILYAVKSKRSS